MNDYKLNEIKERGGLAPSETDKAVRMSDGRSAAPTRAELEGAISVLHDWQNARAELNARVRENRRLWSMANSSGEHGPADPDISAGWLFHSVANKHADAMDSLPEPCVLPREEDDREEAARLSAVLPVILDGCDYEQLYSDLWWAKLIDGTAVTGVFWEAAANGGRGEISLCKIDLLNIYWEPGVRDLQDSRYVFTLDRRHNSALTEEYPFLEGRLSGDDGGYSTVIDWYYRKKGRLHLCRFVGGDVLFCSEGGYPDGWYRHGRFPFAIDSMYPESGSLCGFGAVDVAKNAQRAIDRLDSVIMKNALSNARPRYFVRVDGGVSESEFADTENELVHVSSSALGEDSIRQITPVPLSDIYTEVLRMKIDELKEISGNRDFTQGYTKGGVTSGVAISMLQEAGNKLSRDLIKSGYRALNTVCYLIIELIREFYVSPRCFRTAAGYLHYDNSALCPVPNGRIYGLDKPVRQPHFDIRVEQCKASPFTRELANERAIQLWNSGFFKPENRDAALCALDIMDFDGKARLRSLILGSGGGAE